MPKTGGNSIQNVLRHYSEDVITAKFEFQDGVERFGVYNPKYGRIKHWTISNYKDALDPATYASLFKFAAVRNPWDRAISHYFSSHRKVTEWNRNAFLAMLNDVPVLRSIVCEIHRPAAADSVMGIHDNLLSDLNFILRFERLGEDFKRVCKRIGIPHEPLTRRDASKRVHYFRYYDEELKQIVGERFREEIAAFGYGFEPES